MAVRRRGASVASTDIQDFSDRLESLANKVDSLRRYL
jgi:hypothetical protein